MSEPVPALWSPADPVDALPVFRIPLAYAVDTLRPGRVAVVLIDPFASLRGMLCVLDLADHQARSKEYGLVSLGERLLERKLSLPPLALSVVELVDDGRCQVIAYALDLNSQDEPVVVYRPLAEPAVAPMVGAWYFQPVDDFQKAVRPAEIDG